MKFAIFSDIDALGEYSLRNKSEKDKHYMIPLTRGIPKKYNKLVNITKKGDSQIQRAN